MYFSKYTFVTVLCSGTLSDVSDVAETGVSEIMRYTALTDTSDSWRCTGHGENKIEFPGLTLKYPDLVGTLQGTEYLVVLHSNDRNYCKLLRQGDNGKLSQ